MKKLINYSPLSWFLLWVAVDWLFFCRVLGLVHNVSYLVIASLVYVFFVVWQTMRVVEAYRVLKRAKNSSNLNSA